MCMALGGDQIDEAEAGAACCVAGRSLQATTSTSARTQRPRSAAGGSIAQVQSIGSSRFGAAADTGSGRILLADAALTKLIAFACGAGVLVEL
jgi:hypothetical protein